MSVKIHPTWRVCPRPSSRVVILLTATRESLVAGTCPYPGVPVIRVGNQDMALLLHLLLGVSCPSPLELGHYDGRERGMENGSESVFGRRHLEAAA